MFIDILPSVHYNTDGEESPLDRFNCTPAASSHGKPAGVFEEKKKERRKV